MFITDLNFIPIYLLKLIIIISYVLCPQTYVKCVYYFEAGP